MYLGDYSKGFFFLTHYVNLWEKNNKVLIMPYDRLPPFPLTNQCTLLEGPQDVCAVEEAVGPSSMVVSDGFYTELSFILVQLLPTLIAASSIFLLLDLYRKRSVDFNVIHDYVMVLLGLAVILSDVVVPMFLTEDVKQSPFLFQVPGACDFFIRGIGAVLTGMLIEGQTPCSYRPFINVGFLVNHQLMMLAGDLGSKGFASFNESMMWAAVTAWIIDECQVHLFPVSREEAVKLALAHLVSIEKQFKLDTHDWLHEKYDIPISYLSNDHYVGLQDLRDVLKGDDAHEKYARLHQSKPDTYPRFREFSCFAVNRSRVQKLTNQFMQDTAEFVAKQQDRVDNVCATFQAAAAAADEASSREHAAITNDLIKSTLEAGNKQEIAEKQREIEVTKISRELAQARGELENTQLEAQIKQNELAGELAQAQDQLEDTQYELEDTHDALAAASQRLAQSTANLPASVDECRAYFARLPDCESPAYLLAQLSEDEYEQVLVLFKNKTEHSDFLCPISCDIIRCPVYLLNIGVESTNVLYDFGSLLDGHNQLQVRRIPMLQGVDVLKVEVARQFVGRIYSAIESVIAEWRSSQQAEPKSAAGVAQHTDEVPVAGHRQSLFPTVETANAQAASAQEESAQEASAQEASAQPV
jgi:hypothetical protein